MDRTVNTHTRIRNKMRDTKLRALINSIRKDIPSSSSSSSCSSSRSHRLRRSRRPRSSSVRSTRLPNQALTHVTTAEIRGTWPRTVLSHDEKCHSKCPKYPLSWPLWTKVLEWCRGQRWCSSESALAASCHHQV